jgi:hypothetical protein
MSAFSVEGWFKTSNASGSIFSYDNSGQSPGNPTRVFQFYIFNGQFVFLPLMSSGAYVVCTSISTTLHDGNWHHAVGTYDGSSAKLYIDGVLQSTQALTGSTPAGGGQPLLIGTGSNNAIGNYLPYTGSIDEVALYGSALSSTRVTAHFNAALDDGLAPAFATVIPYSENGNLHLLYKLSQGYGVPVNISVTGDLTQSFGPLSSGRRSHVNLTGVTSGQTYNLTITATNTYGTGTGYNITCTHTGNGYVDVVMQDNPAVLHQSNETAGTIAYDYSLNDRDGSYGGTVALNDTTDPAVGATQIPKHVRLDGTSGHVMLDSSNWLTPASGMTFEAICYFRSLPSFARIFDFSPTPSSVGFLLTSPNGGTNIRFYNGGSSYFDTSTYSLNTWAHIAVTMSGTGQVKMYVNGQLKGSGTVTAPANGVRAYKYLGRSNYNGDPYLPASFAHTAVYNQELTASRIYAHFAAMGLPAAGTQMSRMSATALTTDGTINRINSRNSVQTLASDGTINRTLSRIGVQVLVKTKARYIGWGQTRT